MLKMVMEDYRMDLRAIWREDARKKTSNLLFYICLWCFWPGTVQETSWGTPRFICCIVLFLTLGIVMSLSAAYKNHLSKMFYLIPVSETERKYYLRTGYVFRVIFGTLVEVPFLAACIVIGGMKWQGGLLCMLGILLAMAMNNLRSVAEGTKRRLRWQETAKEWCMFLLSLASIVLVWLLFVAWLQQG